MNRLVRVELRRLFARRLVVLTMLGTLVASLLVLLGVWNSAQPMSAEELALAEEMYQQELEYWQEEGEEAVAQCFEDEAEEAERTGEAVDYGCEQMGPPQREWYVWSAPPLEDTLPSVLGMHSSLLLFAALLVGATLTAAELTTGAITTWLSFEPRRVRVYASKVVAAALGIVPVAVLAVGIVVAGTVVINQHFDLAAGMTSAHWTDTAWMAGRVVGLAVLAALAGAALGFLARHTAAVLGLGVVYLIGDQLLRGLLPASTPWLLSTNVAGWVAHGTAYYTEECTTDARGMVCEMTEHAVGFGHSATYVLVAAVVLAVLGAVVFRRRDAA